MNNYLHKKMIIFLFKELGLKLSIKNNTPLPISLWRYGMLTIDELDKLYTFLFQKME